MDDYQLEEMDACKRWIDRDFSSVPLSILQKLYAIDPDEIVLLSSEYPDEGREIFPMWGWLFNPCDASDSRWIAEHIEEVENCGFFIYEQEDYGILLGIHGAGYAFFEPHWLPLYRARGLKWHIRDDQEEVTT